MAWNDLDWEISSLWTGHIHKGAILDIGETLLPASVLQRFSLRIITPGGYSNYSWRGVRPKVRNPYPHLRIFFPQKTADFTGGFFRNFRKSGPISKGFSTSKMADFTIFCNFCEMGPPSKDFLIKMGPMS